MPRPRPPSVLSRVLPAVAPLLLALPAAAGTPAGTDAGKAAGKPGGSLEGTVVLPPAPADGAAAADARPLCYWRLENGVLPIAPPLPASKAGIPVVLEPIAPTPKAPPKKDQNGDPVPVPLEAGPLGMSPPLLVVNVNEPIDLHNHDKVPHTYYLVDGERFLPRQVTPPGGHRQVKFSVPSTYRIADAGSARGGATVLVVAEGDTHALTDEDGGFTVDAPEGRYELRAFYHGAWSPPQEVEVGKKKAEVTVRLAEPAARAGAGAGTGAGATTGAALPGPSGRVAAGKRRP